MRAVGQISVVLALVFATACQPELPSLSATAIDPASGPSDEAVTVRVEGSFPRVVHTDFVDPSASVVSTFSVTIGSVSVVSLNAAEDGALHVPLPAGVPPGIHDVVVTSSDGRTATLERAYRSISTPAALTLSAIAPQLEGVPFPVTVAVVDRVGQIALDVTGEFLLSDLTGTVTPSQVQVVSGAWTGELTVTDPHPADVLSASFGSLAIQSDPFSVTARVPAGLGFGTTPFNTAAGECTGPVRLQLEDANGLPVEADRPLTATLTIQPSATAALFTDAACSSAVGAAPFAAGQVSTDLWFRGTAVGLVTVEATAPGLSSTSQDHTLGPGATASFRFADLPVSPQDRPFAVRIEATDAHGNLTPAFADPATLSIAPALALTCPSGCAAGTTATVPFVAGVWTGSLSVLEAANGVRLTATSGSASGASAPFDIRRRTPPVAQFVRAPAVVTPGGTVGFDATRAYDAETAADSLEVSWEFEAALDSAAVPPASPWSAYSAARTTSHVYSNPGLYFVRLAVRDADGDVGYSARELVRVTADVPCVVNTLSATDDGATSCDGGHGTDGRLSFPEAVRLSNSTAGTQVVTFDFALLPAGTEPRIQCNGCSGTTLTFSDSIEVYGRYQQGMDVQVAGWDWQFTGGSSVISSVQFSRETLADRRITVGANATVRFVRSTFRDFQNLTVNGRAELEDTSIRRCTGACVIVDGTAASLKMRGGELTVGQSSFSLITNGIVARNCGAGSTPAVDLMSVGLVDTGSNGVLLEASCTRRALLVHNTFLGLPTAVNIAGGADHVVVANIISGSTTSAANCGTATFAERGNNLLHANATEGCLAGDAGNVTGDPDFVDARHSAPDLRLLRSSPARDAAPDRNEDLNGPGPGRFFGAAPDIGGRESW